MKKWLFIPTILFSLFSGSTFGEEAAKTFALLISGEEQGYLEPCGCTPGMLGGIPRQLSAIEQARLAYPDLILLHNGNGIHQFGRQSELKRDVLIQAFNHNQVDVTGIGINDFILGRDSLSLFKEKANFPFLASNLIDEKNEFQKEWSKKIGASVVRVFSLYGLSEQSKLNQFTDSIQIEPVKTFFKQWRDKKKENEFWVILFHGSPKQAYQLTGYSDIVDLIVYNQGGDIPFYQQIGSVHTLSTGKKGRYLILAEFQAAPPFQLINVSRITLDHQYPEHSFGKQLLEQYKLNLKTERLAEKYPKVSWPDQAQYVGSQKCATCHKTEYDVWKKSKHASALEPLKKENNHFDPDCLPCHTTGFNFKGGFTHFEKTKNSGNIGCESCHGPRSRHIQNPSVAQDPKPVHSACLDCHDSENSPNFDFDLYWAKIKHKK